MAHFEQTLEKNFNRVVKKNNATCTSELGATELSLYYTEDGKLVAYIDNGLNTYHIKVGDEWYGYEKD